MEANKLKEAVVEAKRFIQRAEDLQVMAGHTNSYIGGYPAEQGAVKRASMDLTRALAKLRNTKD